MGRFNTSNANLDREMKKNLESKVEDFFASGRGKKSLRIMPTLTEDLMRYSIYSDCIASPSLS